VAKDTFVEKARETYMGCMYIFDLCTGIRLGEVPGLQWGDMDLEGKTLHIMRTISMQNWREAALSVRGRRSRFCTVRILSVRALSVILSTLPVPNSGCR